MVVQRVIHLVMVGGAVEVVDSLQMDMVVIVHGMEEAQEHVEVLVVVSPLQTDV